MYPYLAKSQDLYSTNPMDHFLGPESQKRNNAESGFSSGFTYNQSGSSKDVFSFSNSTDVFSQRSKDEPDSQAHGKGTKFQNYISQNLILGSLNTPRSVLSNRSKCDYSDPFSARAKKVPEASPVDSNGEIIKEIRNVGENLQKNSQKSESCMLSMQNIMEEVKIISKDLKIVKETQAKLFRKIEENHEDYEKNIEILSSKISENAQYLKQLKLQAEKYDEQQNFCKKVFKDIEDEQKHFEKYTKNMVTDIGLKIHNSMRGLRDNLEENLDGKFSALRNFISISNEEKQRNDDYWRHKKLLSRQNIAIADSPCFVSTNYASSISKPNFEDGCRDNYGLNSEKYLMNSSNHLGERARNFSHYGIVPEDSPMFSKMLENKLQKSSTCNPFNYGAKFILKKNLNTSRGQNASNLNISKESLAKTQVKSGEKEVFAISPDVLSCDKMGYVGKLRSSKRKTLNAKRTAVPLPKKKRKNCSKNQKQKKIKKTTPQNQNDKSNSIKTVKAPVMRKLKSSSKTITATSNAGVTSCTLFSASFCSSPGLNLYEAMNFKKEQQYFA